MTRRVDWAESARQDVLHQIAHIAADNPKAAERVAKAIRATGEALAEFATGHPGRVAGTYEKSVSRLPYILAYALTDGDEVVSILRVIYASRDWQDDGWPE